jgi:sugar phosphate isomerase/epimerase
VLETAAVLGARYLNVICADPDTGRTADRLAELVRLARPYRVRPVVEFMAWLPVRTLAGAVAIVTGSDGAGLLLDALHIRRCGVTTAEVTALDPGLLTYLQLCDAPAAPPPGTDAIAEARTGRLLPGEGELPLGDLLGAVPDGLPAAAETPSLTARRGLTPAQFAARVRRALESVLS